MAEGKNNRQIGTEQEEIAAAYLRQNGLTILERNYRCRQGEIDIIARDGICFVFVEVKYRRNSSMGLPAQAVDGRKQQKIRMVARYYLYEHQHGEEIPCRFDVIGILGKDIQWIKDAF